MSSPKAFAGGRHLAFEVALDEGIEPAVEHRLGVALLDPGAVVLDHPVGVQHVGADLAAPGVVHFQVFERLAGFLALPDLEVVEPRAEDLHRGRAILDLAALVLAGHHDAGRQVGEADRRIGLVDVLAAGAARAVGVDPQILVVDLDHHVVVDLRHHAHRSERGVAAGRRVVGADPHQAVHPGLALEVAVGVFAAHRERRAL